MCTLTWTHRRSVPGAQTGYGLFFNRDERLTRGPELPPRIEVCGGVRYVSPTDTDAGGTWIAVNEYGVTVALLNGYTESRGPAREEWTSRGELVRTLADLTGPREAWGRLSPRLLVPFRPAVIAVIAPSGPSLVARWDGLTLTVDGRAERQLPLTSSSYEQDDVQTARRRMYRAMVPMADDGSPPTVESLRAFQMHITAKGPTAYTPSMARPDAATRSQCFIEVDDELVRFHYTPGPPHATTSGPPVDLERTRP